MADRMLRVYMDIDGIPTKLGQLRFDLIKESASAILNLNKDKTVCYLVSVEFIKNIARILGFAHAELNKELCY